MNYYMCRTQRVLVGYKVVYGWTYGAVAPNGSQWYQLASTMHGFTGPAFTPDGTRAAWAEALDSSNLAVDVFGDWKLRLSNFVDSTGIPLLKNTSDITPTGARWVEPGNFSSNGVSLLISSDVGMTNAQGQDQFILNVNNGNIQNLTNSPMVWDEHGVFSPDGAKVLFMSSYPYRADTNSYHTLTIKTEFMLMDTDGSQLQQLTHFCDTGYIESDSGIAATGFWNHSGSVIYAQSLLFPNYANWIIDFNGNCGNNTLTNTAINQPAGNNFNIFPNPTQNNLTLQTAFELHNASLSIFNDIGQIVKVMDVLNGSEINIETNQLQSGIYFIQLQAGDQRITGMFVKQE